MKNYSKVTHWISSISLVTNLVLENDTLFQAKNLPKEKVLVTHFLKKPCNSYYDMNCYFPSQPSK